MFRSYDAWKLDTPPRLDDGPDDDDPGGGIADPKWDMTRDTDDDADDSDLDDSSGGGPVGKEAQG